MSEEKGEGRRGIGLVSEGRWRREKRARARE